MRHPTRCLMIAGIALSTVNAVQAEEEEDNGRFYINFNLREELVEQDNALDDASALTLRTAIGYESPVWRGLSALVELEDSRIIASQDEFSVGPTGFNPGQYSVIADPENTELNQGYINYENASFLVRLGRQEINRDNQRFVGAVAWRQDHQSFDAATLGWKPADNLDLQYSYVTKRNRIFGDMADIDSADQLIDMHYQTPIGKLTAYAYLLETDDAVPDELDTLGLSFRGSTKRSFGTLSYAVEYASQDHSLGGVDNDADYLLVEGGVGLKAVELKLGYELLGSDDGLYGFSTPLATLHKFNGWADQFLSTPDQGLVDTYVSVGGKFRAGKWTVAHHDFSADHATPDADDFGSEIDVAATWTFAEKYTVGGKFAIYSAGDAGTGKVDTDKFWVWFTTGF